jgi:hypothetical protein
LIPVEKIGFALLWRKSAVRRDLSLHLRCGNAVIESVAQIELNAKPVSNFFRASLVSDQIARRGNNIGLPSVGVVSANEDLQSGGSDFRGDHLSEISCGDAFLDHDEFPKKQKRPRE